MKPGTAAVVLALCLAVHFLLASARDEGGLREVVWGTVIYTTIGDSSPETWKDRALTPLGGQQLYDAGTAIANRYVRPLANETIISGISSQTLVNSEMEIIAKNDAPSVGSAMAFMQGLYPVRENRDKSGPDGKAYYPYAGYQYPLVKAADDDSQLVVQVAGNEECPNYAKAVNTYAGTDEFAETMNQTEHFYKELGRHDLKNAFAEGTVSYSSASPVWDYLRYQYPRSSGLQTSMSQAELVQARELAGKFEWAVNSQVTMDGKKVGGKDIKAIHGKTFARIVIDAIRDNIDSRGVHNKMTLLFGDHRPMMAFASLSSLASQRQSAFYSLPNGGASFIFELFSYAEFPSNDTSIGKKYPTEDLLNVRFFMRNETSSSEPNFRSYPMFDHSPSKAAMPLSEFLASMKNISVQPAEWCKLCDSKKAFCSRRGGGSPGTDHDLDDDDDDDADYWEGYGKKWWRCDKHDRHVYTVQGGFLGALTTFFLACFLQIYVVHHLKRKYGSPNYRRPQPSRPRHSRSHRRSGGGGGGGGGRGGNGNTGIHRRPFFVWLFQRKPANGNQTSNSGPASTAQDGVSRPAQAYSRGHSVRWQPPRLTEEHIELESQTDSNGSSTITPSGYAYSVRYLTTTTGDYQV
ncbi:hypothetical protein KEM56_001741 [Ascosphaera pollenicola]|nr:hypothetical protein KEM56_001741 [Ascosphaera pollenicola]